MKDEGREESDKREDEPVCLGSDLGSERDGSESDDEAWEASEASTAARAAWKVCSVSERFLPRPR